LNGNAKSIQQLGQHLQAFRLKDCIPLVFHRQKDGYDYRMRSDTWTLSANDECILLLERELGKAAFYIEYH
jgi:hypothetical protein